MYNLVYDKKMLLPLRHYLQFSKVKKTSLQNNANVRNILDRLYEQERLELHIGQERQ